MDFFNTFISNLALQFIFGVRNLEDAGTTMQQKADVNRCSDCMLQLYIYCSFEYTRVVLPSNQRWSNLEQLNNHTKLYTWRK